MENTLISEMSYMRLQSMSDKRALRSFYPGEQIASIGTSVRVVYWHTDDLSQGCKIPRSCRVRLELTPTEWKSDVIAKFLREHNVETLNICGACVDSFDFLRTCCGLEKFHAAGVKFSYVHDSERTKTIKSTHESNDKLSSLFSAEFSSLRVLDLDNTHIHDIKSFLKYLPTMDNLQVLHLCGADNMHIGDLSRFPRIRELFISLTRGGLTLTWDVTVNRFPLTINIGPCRLIIGDDDCIDVFSDLESLVVLHHEGALSGLWSMIYKIDLIGYDDAVCNDHKHVSSVLDLDDEFDYDGGFINLMCFRRKNIR